MSGGLDVLAMKEDDVTKMLAAGVHLGDSNVNYQMEQYIYSVRTDGEFTELLITLLLCEIWILHNCLSVQLQYRV